MMVKIRVVPEARSLDPDSVVGSAVVVIDTLRATTTIAQAVAQGAAVEPVPSIAEAKRRRTKGVLIAGERGGKKLAGFDLGNSPVDISKATLGKRLVLTTTNGTGAVARSRQAKSIWAGALVNAGAIARALRGEASIVLLCAGRTTGLALEDLIGAGAIIAALPAGSFEESALSDGARIALELFRRERDTLHAFIASCESGRNLVKMGSADDVVFCAQLDTIDVAPRLVRGRFVR
jgi:2-phosphosulfolactate phosphatase